MINTSSMVWVLAAGTACVEPYESGWAPYGRFEQLEGPSTAIDIFSPPPVISVVRYRGIDDRPGMIKFLPVAYGGVKIQLTSGVVSSATDLDRSWMIRGGVPGVLTTSSLYFAAQNEVDHPVCPSAFDTAFPAFTYTEGCVEYGGVARIPGDISGAPVVRKPCSKMNVIIVLAVMLSTVAVACAVFCVLARDLAAKNSAPAVPPPYSPPPRNTPPPSPAQHI